MSFFKKLMQVFQPSEQVEENSAVQQSQYLPEQRLPVDDLFTLNFKENGGKFLYCESLDELNECFVNILVENDWFETEAQTYETSLYSMLQENNIKYSEVKNPTFFFSGCENLIAEDGSILFCDKQIKNNKANDLPDNIVIIARTSQMTRTKSDGLREIKRKYGSALPSNITTFNYFKPSTNESDFLSYGRSPKNLYLLLLEDL
ncbi:lactate utilization protein [Myroides sp. M-43]|uniref:LUD domain-containing protein n=1 Tax=Myroides oncorhynchi TaxID=2893756 RepID=UPI001E5D6D27|nr:LUD domain-containing protein [Myroides oncorhynchi]MCC9041354.1 lactate utilization protein [Myroides oncorhynchi]